MRLLKQTRPLEDFIPHILVSTVTKDSEEGIPENLALSFARNAAITFADRSGCLVREIDLDLQCGLGEYPIEMLDCETVIGIEWAHVGEFSQGDCGGCSWNFGNVCFDFEDDVLKISPPPKQDMDNGLKAKVVVTPSRDACKLDEQFYTKWFDAILHGALAEVFGMPGQPWSSVTRSRERRQLFNEEVSRLSIRKTLRGHREPLSRSPFMAHPWSSGRGKRNRRMY